MAHSNYLPEFEKEFNQLLKKFRSLDDDIKIFERFIFENPTGLGKNFTIIHNNENLKLVKARILCRSLRSRNIRIIYAYHDDIFEFVYIEIYFKGDKPNEDKKRIEEYLSKFSK
ncbi:hypothetical protein HYW73_00480 [Candidatus Nomurabacteria bacterium]|nr:hypothetical protein [Candidatus Nomurabacteria bacterium]